ncbi:MAG TPA: protein-L-isoaspartate(D-aspartate) O-methyltransferase [Dongiaceae bacterium]|jgi:protein-L-isoaspartate(D-aspartate) O-methyltransferase|nr:protein-L-isoaspartate(D-aspartate) O-methyltransferase [Dongiaceae bacterium]
MYSTGKERAIPRLSSVVATVALLLVVAPQAVAVDAYSSDRLEMVRTIEAIAREVGGGATPSVLGMDVLDAMRRTPRHAFVPTYLQSLAYADRPLPIGYGQTISQPYIVALMTDLLRLAPGGRALEIGTGSGYQAAVLAELGHDVYTIEIVPDLAKQAAKRLSELGYDKVRVREGDGYFGWPDAAPFDGIVVTAASQQIPPPLIDQLKPGGRMVIPIGAAFLTQELILVEKLANGTVRTEAVLPVSFVPLTRSQ